MTEPLDDLLVQLSSGDTAAMEQVFLAYEPYLRKAVCRQFPTSLRSRLDPSDIIQSVWADLLRGFREAGWRFSDPDHLRGFLYVATRNRLLDRVRQHQKAVDREEPIAARGGQPRLASAQPRPSELAQAADLWQRILTHSPPEHRSLLELKREGYSLTEIGERTGLHPDSVRRILRTLARQLAFKQTPMAELDGRPGS
jgi:RNA polymerase sigma-70 factor (ECF subfamily)